MTANRTDARLDGPLATDLVADAAALYDRIGGALPGSLARPLEPAAEVDEFATLLPYTHRVDDITRLVARLLDCLVDGDATVEDMLEELASYAESAAGDRVARGYLSGMLLVAFGSERETPLMIRDQFLLPAEEFAELPEKLTAAIFAAAVVVLRTVTAYVHGCFRMPEMSYGDVLRTLLEGDATD